VGGAVDVLVLDAKGEPIAQARVDREDPSGERGSPRSTDARGIARFEQLAPGSHSFRLAPRRGSGVVVQASVRTPGGAGAGGAAREGWEVVEVRNGARTALTLTKPAAGTLAGIVRESGRPLAGARVTLLEGPGQASAEASAALEMRARLLDMFGGGAGSDKTDGGGEYELSEVPAGPHRLRITHPDRAMPTIVAVEVREGANTRDVDLDTAVLSGRVVGPDGAPLAGATVSARVVRPESEGAVELAGAFEAAGELIGGARRSGDGTKTDDDGSFELYGVQPNVPLVVQASADGFVTGTSQAVQVDAGGSRSGVEVRLARAGKVVVVVQGEQLLGAVRATPEGGETSGAKPALGFLRNGRATLDGLQPGRWQVKLSALGEGEDQVQTVDVVAGETAQVTFSR
jgi:hypothetical protein